MRLPPRIALALVLGATTCTPDKPVKPPEPPVVVEAPPRPPRLVVMIVIDQLPSWSFDVQRTALDGGIARMLSDGAYWPRARYPYATTNTAPGHATIATGTTPHDHGIVANRWFDREAGRRVEAAEDASKPVWDPVTGDRSERGVSNARLLVDGLADALHAARPSARAVSIAWKPRAAVLQLGRGPDLALWFDGKVGAMTTSAAFADVVPPWLGDLAKRSIADPARHATWQPMDARVAKLSGRPDDAPDEANPVGLSHVYPYDADDTPAPNDALSSMPLAHTITVDAAIAAIEHEHLGADEVPDVLAVSFSAHDHAGHAWCQESWERVDHLLHIDRELARLFEHLDETLGEGAWSAALTSDHGTLPSRVLLAERGITSTLYFTEDIAKWANDVAVGLLGPGTWVLGVTTVDVTMTTAFGKRSETDRDRVLDAIRTDLLARGIGTVVRTDRNPATCTGDDLAAMICHSIHPRHSGDLYLVSKEWDLVNDDRSECSAHGSPWIYDREVPIIVMGSGVRPGARSEAPSMLQVAPTIAALLGVPPPSHAHQPALPLD